ncbi:MAG: hypothetical protein DCC49_13025 [Acidobacteria bacterium]|nr:MAG: hypothetical protein DCC49_13025 [Acidobacteriota bacterium]
MTKRNLTVQVDDDTIRRAKVLAARRNMSVSAIVAAEIKRLADDDERYEESRERAERAMRRATPRGGRTWSRHELHDR